LAPAQRRRAVHRPTDRVHAVGCARARAAAARIRRNADGSARSLARRRVDGRRARRRARQTPQAHDADRVIDRAAAGRRPVRAGDPYTPANLSAYDAIVTALARRHIPRDRAVAGMSYRLGDATVDVLWPGVERMQDTPADINNTSIVMRVRYGNDTVLLAG